MSRWKLRPSGPGDLPASKLPCGAFPRKLSARRERTGCTSDAEDFQLVHGLHRNLYEIGLLVKAGVGQLWRNLTSELGSGAPFPPLKAATFHRRLTGGRQPTWLPHTRQRSSQLMR